MFHNNDEYLSDIITTSKQIKILKFLKFLTFPIWIITSLIDTIYKLFKKDEISKSESILTKH